MSNGPERRPDRPSRRPDDPFRPSPGGLQVREAEVDDAPRSAEWRGERIAHSEEWVEVDGQVYFPEEDVEEGFLRETDTTFEHDRLGTVRWYDLRVEGDVLEEAAWTVRDPAPAAEDVAGYYGFGQTVVVT